MSTPEKWLLFLGFPIVILRLVLLVVFYAVMAVYRFIIYLFFIAITPFLILLEKKYPKEYSRRNIASSTGLLIEYLYEDWIDINELLVRF